MPLAAPLQVTVEIALASGSAKGERRFRLSHELELPPRLLFSGALPLDGRGEGEVLFMLPDGQQISARATLAFDPAHPEAGSSALLEGLDEAQAECLQRYVKERIKQ
ncbi:MAG: hypothetical protein JRH20_12525 [Deltaproteobacteria bacterium]|nr:hypothetical protein [Deltaproteobacteria bacterium]